MLPPENATGNWVKVVQRLPVRLAVIDAPHSLALRAGLSADVSVDTRHVRSALVASLERSSAADRTP
jgi:membrane fusion protein (multidrug efflux system)